MQYVAALVPLLILPTMQAMQQEITPCEPPACSIVLPAPVAPFSDRPELAAILKRYQLDEAIRLEVERGAHKSVWSALTKARDEPATDAAWSNVISAREVARRLAMSQRVTAEADIASFVAGMLAAGAMPHEVEPIADHFRGNVHAQLRRNDDLGLTVARAEADAIQSSR